MFRPVFPSARGRAVSGVHGPHRQTVASHRTSDPETQTSQGRQGTPDEVRRARAGEWHALDFAHRSAVEVFAKGVSAASDDTSLVSAMECGRNLGIDSPRTRQRPLHTWWLIARRGFHRWKLRSGQKRGLYVGPTKAGKGTKRMVVVDGNGTPLGVCIESASPAEIKLVNTVLDTIPAHLLPEFLIGDRAYDSDPKDAELLSEYDVKLVSPNRSNRIRRTQDGRTLRRYRRRWIVERTNAWLLNFRRIVNRWEHRASNYAGFLRLACIVIMLRQF